MHWQYNSVFRLLSFFWEVSCESKPGCCRRLPFWPLLKVSVSFVLRFRCDASGCLEFFCSSCWLHGSSWIWKLVPSQFCDNSCPYSVTILNLRSPSLSALPVSKTLVRGRAGFLTVPRPSRLGHSLSPWTASGQLQSLSFPGPLGSCVCVAASSDHSVFVYRFLISFCKSVWLLLTVMYSFPTFSSFFFCVFKHFKCYLLFYVK